MGSRGTRVGLDGKFERSGRAPGDWRRSRWGILAGATWAQRNVYVSDDTIWIQAAPDEVWSK